jgi:hypothetical protein
MCFFFFFVFFYHLRHHPRTMPLLQLLLPIRPWNEWGLLGVPQSFPQLPPQSSLCHVFNLPLSDVWWMRANLLCLCLCLSLAVCLCVCVCVFLSLTFYPDDLNWTLEGILDSSCGSQEDFNLSGSKQMSFACALILILNVSQMRFACSWFTFLM